MVLSEKYRSKPDAGCCAPPREMTQNAMIAATPLVRMTLIIRRRVYATLTKLLSSFPIHVRHSSVVRSTALQRLNVGEAEMLDRRIAMRRANSGMGVAFIVAVGLLGVLGAESAVNADR